MAAGFVEVWSTMRLLTKRGWLSKTLPFFWAYDVATGGPNSGGFASAARKSGVVSRGNGTSAAANVSRPAKRLLHEPSTVRSP